MIVFCNIGDRERERLLLTVVELLQGFREGKVYESASHPEVSWLTQSDKFGCLA